jgi:hypothetical protein
VKLWLIDIKLRMVGIPQMLGSPASVEPIDQLQASRNMANETLHSPDEKFLLHVADNPVVIIWTCLAGAAERRYHQSEIRYIYAGMLPFLVPASA